MRDNARSSSYTNTLLRLSSPARSPVASFHLRLQSDKDHWIVSSMDPDNRSLRHSNSPERGLPVPDALTPCRPGQYAYRISGSHNDYYQLDSQPRRGSSPISRVLRTCPKIPKPSKECLNPTRIRGRETTRPPRISSYYSGRPQRKHHFQPLQLFHKEGSRLTD